MRDRGECLLIGRKAALLATVSVCAVLSGQANAQAPVEEVVVTGSLIRGGEVVGVPVTSLGQDDFDATGAITVTDLLKTVPGVIVSPSVSPNMVGGNFLRASTVDIHGLNAFTGSPRTLILIDGIRYPYTGQTGEKADISFLPELGVSRLDVVVSGASATYGSDAMAGVVNAVLRRNFDGAISQVSAGTPEGGGFHWTASQLFGRSWDSGNITLAFTHYDIKRIEGRARPDVFTTDFTPWGLDDRTPVRTTTPGIVSIGNASPANGTGCTNCFSVPKGQGNAPGSLAWTTLLANAGVANQVDGYATGEGIPPQTSNAISAVLDQDLWPGVHLFGEAYYSNRRGLHVSNPVNGTGRFSAVTLVVPTDNPFYPTGAPVFAPPNTLRVNYNFATELPPSTSYYEINGRFSLGATIELPYEWEGKIQASQSASNVGFRFFNIPNATAANAALGTPQSVPAAGVIPAVTVTKPATIPFLNLFCDPTAFVCNSPATLAFINSGETSVTRQVLNQMDVSASGTILTLPAGDVRLALGGSLIRHNYNQFNLSDFLQPSPALPFLLTTSAFRNSYALYGELFVPIVSEANALPLVQSLEAQLSLRYDNYDIFGTTTNPRVAINWVPVDGLTLRGAWGRSFRVPTFVDLNGAPLARPLNTIVGGFEEEYQTCPEIGGTPVPGSIGAILNPTCDASLFNPGGIAVEGGGDVNNIFGRGLSRPEESEDYSIGFRYAPTDNFLAGLDIDVAYWNNNITGLITNIFSTQVDLTDPDTAFVVTVNDGSAAFADKVNLLINDPSALDFVPGAASNVLFLIDALSRNVGSLKTSGIDFSVNYNWAGGDLGDWSTGVIGTYYIKRTTSLPTSTVDVFDVTTSFDFVSGAVAAAGGQAQAVRFKYRGHIGWTMDNFAVTAFVNYRSHLFHINALPPTAVMLASGITDYSNLIPSHYTFDLAMSYDFADLPANDYLKNIKLGVVVNNILDRKPPFAYQTLGGSTGTVAYFGAVDSPIGRDFTVTLTKTW